MAVIGEILKTFGAAGELIIKLYDEAPEELNLDEPVFIVMDGLPVPFYFKLFEARGNNRAQVVFDDFETQKQAEELVSKKIELKIENGNSKILNSQFSILNYKVVDKQIGELGTIVGFLDIPGNPCLQIDYNGRELLIPFHENFIVKIDSKKHTLQVDIPQSLLNLGE